MLIVASVACRGAAASAPKALAVEKQDVCAGLDVEACQERLIVQSLCLQEPGGEGCEALRADGLLPPEAPSLGGLLRCWAVADPRDDRPSAWICAGDSDVAIHGRGVWDVWPHGGWRREDTVRRAGWVAEREGGGSLWLTVVGLELHLADGTGALSATLVAGDRAIAEEVSERRAALPQPSAVCAAARACLAAMPRPPQPPQPPIEMEVEAAPDPLAGIVTLRGCHEAWRAAVDRLDQAIERADIPATCAIVTASDDAWTTWTAPLRPPFAPIDDTDGW